MHKDPVKVLKSIMNSDPSFKHEFRKSAPCRGDIRDGLVFREAFAEIRKIDIKGSLVGVMLAIDDTPLTQHSGTHNGRPVYITTANQSLDSRRKRDTHAWRLLALLPVLKLDEDEQTTVDKKWCTHAKAEFNNRALEVVLKPLSGKQYYPYIVRTNLICSDIRMVGFHCEARKKQFYPRLICCLTDMKEAWCLWGLKYLSCPICTCKRKKFNVQLTPDSCRKLNIQKRPYDGLKYDMKEYESCASQTDKLKLKELMHKERGHFPVRLAFSTVSSTPWKLYIVDLLHQVKKGIFMDLLKFLKKLSKKNGSYNTLLQRMKDITTYPGLEHFGRSWFNVSKITASNYRDMVSIMRTITICQLNTS